jgi:hypothetical protein
MPDARGYNQEGAALSDGDTRVLVGPTGVTFNDLQVADDPEGSARFLKQAADSVLFANALGVYARILLGRQLVRIQELVLWQHFGLDCGNWSEFMERGFHALTGLSRETGYMAIMLARSKSFGALPPDELIGFRTLSNVIDIARMERDGPVSPALLDAAKTLPMDEFRALAGKSKKLVLAIVLDDPSVAAPLGRIVNFIKLAQPDVLAIFLDTIEAAKLRAGDNPSDTLDCIIASCRFQWEQEGELHE